MDFVARVKTKYPYLNEIDVSDIVDKAKMFYYCLRYPCAPNANEETKPIDSFVASRWILSACDEIIERLGFNSAIGYRENGMSWQFDQAELSKSLCDLIKPIAGVI